MREGVGMTEIANYGKIEVEGPQTQSSSSTRVMAGTEFRRSDAFRCRRC